MPICALRSDAAVAILVAFVNDGSHGSGPCSFSCLLEERAEGRIDEEQKLQKQTHSSYGQSHRAGVAWSSAGGRDSELKAESIRSRRQGIERPKRSETAYGTTERHRATAHALRIRQVSITSDY